MHFTSIFSSPTSALENLSKRGLILISLLILFTEFPGWPLFSPLKVQLQKCDKCSREFCSPVNYRRHIRVHHRLKKLDKVFFRSQSIISIILFLLLYTFTLLYFLNDVPRQQLLCFFSLSSSSFHMLFTYCRILQKLRIFQEHIGIR